MRLAATNTRTGFAATVAVLVVVGYWALSGPSAFAEPLMLRPAQPLQVGSSNLDPGDYAIPCASDWNGDGRKDLIVGYRMADKIALYLNTGTDSQPAFTGFTHLKAAGADLYQAGSNCGAPAPWICDYDADGRRDLLVGNGANGQVFFYRNTNSDAQPILAAGVTLMLGSNPLSVGARATPYAFDWDEDGRCDLLVGDGLGQGHFFRNVGTSQSPAYDVDQLLKTSGTNMNLGIRAVLRVFDWDGDGMKDVVGSSSSGVYWCRNKGSNPDPILAAPTSLRSPVSGIGMIPINASGRMRLDLVDWNNDGVMDVFLGNTDGSVLLYGGS